MINKNDAEKLTTKSEFSLYLKAKNLSTLEADSKAIKDWVKRARKLRNKFQDLTKRQTQRGVHGRQKPQRTMAKTKLFQDVLKKFEQKLSSVQKKEISQAKKRSATGKKGSTTRGGVSAKRSSVSTKGRAPGAAKLRSSKAHKILSEFNQHLVATEQPKAKYNNAKIKKSSIKRIQAHQSSRGRRAQGRHDHKNA